MKKPSIFQRPFVRFMCTFLPFLVPHRLNGPTKRQHWETYSTNNFDEMDPASIALLDEVKSLAIDKNTSILDMGCNVGRHLNNLYQDGWKNLNGVDFSATAISDMANRYPEMHNNIKTTVASFQEFLPYCKDGYDLIYTRGATFELVPPSFNLIKNVCRVAKTYVVLVISEAGHAYPRCWEYEFARQGFELVHLRRPAEKNSVNQQHLSLLTFKRLDN
jgi:SAM-dependent methyltransferase